MRNCFVALCVLLLGGCRSDSPRASSQPASPAADSAPAVEMPAGLRFALPTVGQAFLPPTLPARLTEPDLVVHFHGASPTVEHEFVAAGLQAVLVTINYRGLSAAYEHPFSSTTLFGTVLDETLAELRRRGRVSRDSAWRRVCVSSFSAGFGAVRAVLATPENFDRIDGLYLADTLYAGYVDDNGQQRVNPEHMREFRRYAAEAAAGRRTLVLTHSYLVPGAYAGTHETAADLLAFVGLTPEAVDAPGPGGMRIVARAARGRLFVFGCKGTTGNDHMAHLRNLRGWYALLPVASHPPD